MVAFFSIARTLGEGSTSYSPPVFLLLLLLFLLLLLLLFSVEINLSTPIPLFFLGQDQSTVAQRAETTEAE